VNSKLIDSVFALIMLHFAREAPSPIQSSFIVRKRKYSIEYGVDLIYYVSLPEFESKSIAKEKDGTFHLVLNDLTELELKQLKLLLL